MKSQLITTPSSVHYSLVVPLARGQITTSELSRNENSPTVTTVPIPLPTPTQIMATSTPLTEQRVSQTKVSHPNLSCWRLQCLELPPLFAGLDYEVEQKTYPQQLKRTATRRGIVCVAHEPVYGTVGLTNDGAGTHVMAFQKKVLIQELNSVKV